MEKPKVEQATPASLDVLPSLYLNWNACCICQASSGQLNCPANNPVLSRRHLGYLTLGENLEKLRPYNYKLQSGFSVEYLVVDTDVATSLEKMKAKWHKKCALQYQQSEVDNLVEKLKQPSVQCTDHEHSTDQIITITKKKKTRSSSPLVHVQESLCFMCKQPETKRRPLHFVATDNIQENVKTCANKLQDLDLLAVLTQGDLVAIGAKYHLICLKRLYRKSNMQSCQNSEDHELDHERITCESMAFADLFDFMVNKLQKNANYIFQMSTLHKMYQERLSQILGVPVNVHTTRLRHKILAHLPFLEAIESRREYRLKIKGSNIISALITEDQDEDAIHMHSFLKRIRKSVQETKVSFNGSFLDACEESCVPAPLLAVVNSLLYGSPVNVQCRATQPALTICQLIMLNYHESVPKGDVVRNKKEREPPLPMYMALSLYGKGRDKSSIDELHRRGISVSSNRVMDVTSQLCRLVVAQSKEKNLVCPSNLKHDLFTVTAVDNIDHATSSTTSKGSGFHGTAISVFQLPDMSEDGRRQTTAISFNDVKSSGMRSVPELPDFYADVPDYELMKKKPPFPTCTEGITSDMISPEILHNIWECESPWLSHVSEFLQKPTDDGVSLNLSWSAYHAEKETRKFQPAINALLPLFHEKSTDPAMIKHTLNLVKNITEHLNPNQTAVICADQQLYALIKAVQWNWPEQYGESHFVAMLGPLHIEKAFLKVLGQFLEGSGWNIIFGHSEVSSASSAEGFQKVSHITKARNAHQKTAVALYSLLNDAYESSDPDKICTISEWAEDKAKKYPTFKFWLTVFNMEILLLAFLGSVRRGDFTAYKNTFKRMIPFFFAFNHPNYSRWSPVHLFDMITLHEKAPDVLASFESGKFVVNKTGNAHSALGIDHAHEQNNADVKGKGGVVGLTENPSALRRWTIGGPEVHRLLEEFEPHFQKSDTHHEQTNNFQRKYINDCSALKESFLHFENPFCIESSELITLDTRQTASSEAIKNLYALEERGNSQHQEFVITRLEKGTKSIYDVISRVECRIFTLPLKKTVKNPVASLKEDVHLFQRMFIISTARDLNLIEFFQYENQDCPPALSINGTLRSGVKAHLLPILENLIPENTETATLPVCDGIIYDGPALVHQIKPNNSVKNMTEYSDEQLKPHLLSSAQKFKADRVDVAWDLYSQDSIKKVREERGHGLRQQNLPRKGGVPANWEKYLKNSHNKTELFPFLAERLLSTLETKQFVTNVGDTFAKNQLSGSGLHGASCAAMEEADGRIILHVKDMVDNGAKRVLVCCTDTDVLVLAISYFHSLKDAGLSELNFLFGVGAKRRIIAAHTIAEHLGQEKSEALRGFHAFTGCDSVSFFASRGKRTAWSAWRDGHTQAFKAIGCPENSILNENSEIDPEIFEKLENFTLALYTSNKTTLTNVDEARRVLFCSGDRALTSIPPTKSALMQHAKRAAYQAGQLWGKADKLEQTLTSPQNWGWKQSGDTVWEPHWTTQSTHWRVCSELSRCGCATDCIRKSCICRRNKMSCAPICKKCRGNCSNKRERNDYPDVANTSTEI